MSKLSNKVALVTGENRGIEAAIAKRLAADGASVAITYSKGADAAASVVKAIESGGGKAVAIQADASDPKAINAAVEKTVATLGKLDVLVNNAGMAIPKAVRADHARGDGSDDRPQLPRHTGRRTSCKPTLKHMNDSGRIIMISSYVGERNLTPGLVAYAATKGAVKMFYFQGLSREVGSRGITVNNVQPGPIDTDLNPASGDWAAPQKANTALNRYGTVDEGRCASSSISSPVTGEPLTSPERI